MDEFTKEQKRYNQYNDERFDFVLQSLNEIKDFTQKIRAHQLEQNAELVNLQKELSNLNKSFHEIKKHLDFSKSSLEEFSKDLFSLSKNSNEIVNEIEKIKSQAEAEKQACENKFSSLCKFQHAVSESIKKTESQNSLKFENIFENFKIIVDNLDKNLELFSQKINSIKTPDLSPFIQQVHLENLKKELNLYSLDVKNSALKCTNLESQISLLSKKLESVQIILKSKEIESGK